jgi:hypothetical protein
MVQHNDKWKKKATREYHKKHGTLPASRGRGRGRGPPVENEPHPEPQNEEGETSEQDSSEEINEEELESKKERSKYSRRTIESNAWRFESEEPDPYLGTHFTDLLISD